MIEEILVPLLLASTLGEIHGRTRVQKLVFLVQRQASMRNAKSSRFHFELYRYGPYSRELSTQLGNLLAKGYLRMDPETTVGGYTRYSYSLTPEGAALVKEMKEKRMLDEKLLQVISLVSNKYGSMKLPRLVGIAYKYFR